MQPSCAHDVIVDKVHTVLPNLDTKTLTSIVQNNIKKHANRIAKIG